MTRIKIQKIAEIIDDINSQHGASLKQIVRYWSRITQEPDAKKRNFTGEIFRTLKKAEEDGLIRYRRGFYKVSSYGKERMFAKTPEVYEDYESKSSSCQDREGDSSDVSSHHRCYRSPYHQRHTHHGHYHRLCHQCRHCHHSKCGCSGDEEIDSEVQELRDYESPSFNAEKQVNYPKRHKAIRFRLKKRKFGRRHRKYTGFRRRLHVARRSRNNRKRMDSAEKERRCCQRFKRCRSCGQIVVERKNLRTRSSPVQKSTDSDTVSESQNRCYRKDHKKRCESNSEDSQSSYDDKKLRPTSRAKKQQEIESDKNKNILKRFPSKRQINPRKVAKKRFTSNKNKTRLARTKSRTKNKSDRESSTETVSENKTSSRKRKSSSKDNENGKRKKLNSDNESSNKLKGKGDNATRKATPPPTSPDPNVKPGASGIESRESNHSNSPHFPLKIDGDDEDEDDDDNRNDPRKKGGPSKTNLCN